MSKFSRFLVVPCVVIIVALYLIGLNVIKRVDRVDSFRDAIPVPVQNQEDNIVAATDKVNINTADKDELMTIEGVGSETAEAIIKKREELGGFKTIEDIKKVYGIGDKKFENMRDFITAE